MKYRKKPVVIDAIQWTGKNFDEVKDFCPIVDYYTWTQYNETGTNKDILSIPTLEGKMEASKGDYIIKGVEGEFYPCKPNIFELTYTKVEQCA